MFCCRCGSSLWEGDRFCPFCGAPVPVTEPAAEPVTEPVTEPAAEPVTEPVTEPAAEPVTEPAAEPAAEPVTEPAEAYVPSWEQSFSALSLWEARLTGTEPVRKARRRPLGTVLLIALCALLLSAAAVTASLLTRAAAAQLLLSTFYTQDVFGGSAGG